MPALAKTLRGDESALLVETRAANPQELQKMIDRLVQVIKVHLSLAP